MPNNLLAQKQAECHEQRVLLVCAQEGPTPTLDESTINQRFGRYGHLIKTLSYRKPGAVAFFLEFQKHESAVKAKEGLNSKNLFKGGSKMTVYFSNLPNLVCKGVHDLGQIQELATDCLDAYIKSDENSAIDLQADSPKKQTQLQPESLNKMPIEEKDPFQEANFRFIDMLIGSARYIGDRLVLGEHIQFDHDGCPEPYKVYNLFSNFGNVSSIYVKRSCIYVKYKPGTANEDALHQLQENRFEGLKLKISPADEDWKPHDGQWCSMVRYGPQFDRIIRGSTIMKPTQTIFLTCYSKGINPSFNETDFERILELYGNLRSFSVVGEYEYCCVYRVSYLELEGSLRACSSLHNSYLLGQQWSVSFAKE